MLPKEHLQLLHQFVDICTGNSDVLHTPELKFFKDFIEGFGAKIPPKSTSFSSDEPPKQKVEEPEPELEPEEPESDLELDTSGVVSPDNDEPLPMGDESKEVSDEMADQSNDKRSDAAKAASEGRYDDALKLFTEAIQLNPGSALLHAKRANVLLHLNKPNAAIRDCDKALDINPDSAQAYKFRGRANRLLGKWEVAHKDLATACKIDYDDEANAWLKEVEPNFKKIYEHKRKCERKTEEKEEKIRQQRRKQAQEAYEHAKKHQDEECGDEDCGDLPGGMADIFKDPDLMAAFQDPEISQAFMDVSQNPLNIGKYQNNPKIMKILEKLATKMGGGAGIPAGMFNPGAFGAGSQENHPPKPKPDLDID